MTIDHSPSKWTAEQVMWFRELEFKAEQHEQDWLDNFDTIDPPGNPSADEIIERMMFECDYDKEKCELIWAMLPDMGYVRANSEVKN